jgi:DNA-directed RNA polymerase subunit M/transcription elongation factor TFIIS
MADGYHVTYLTCRACRHEWSGVLPDNTLVGKTDRLVCSKCGARDCAVSMSWVWGNPPGTKKDLPQA